MMQTMTKSESITYVQSFTLVKNLFRASFSSIAYIRGLFDDEYFVQAKIGGAKFKKLNDTNNEEVKNFVAWMEHGVFDALSKKYLETVLLEIYEVPESGARKGANPKNRKLLECFSFGVKYSDEGASFTLSTPSGAVGDTSEPTAVKASIKQETKSVIRTLIELSAKLPPLPSNRIIGMKLFYVAGTPADYEPTYFRKADELDVSWFDSKPERVTCGNVTTPYHRISLSVRTARSFLPPSPKQDETSTDTSPKSIIPSTNEKSAISKDNESAEHEQPPTKRVYPTKTTAAAEIRDRMADRKGDNIMKPKGKITKLSSRVVKEKKVAAAKAVSDLDNEPIVNRPTTRAVANKAKNAAKKKKLVTKEDSVAITKRSQRTKKTVDKQEHAYPNETSCQVDNGAPSVWTMSKRSRKISEVKDSIYQSIA